MINNLSDVKFLTGLVKEDSGTRKISTQITSRDVVAETPLEVGRSVRGAISHCDGPDYFFMQALDSVGEIQRFQDDLQTYYQKVGPIAIDSMPKARSNHLFDPSGYVEH